MTKQYGVFYPSVYARVSLGYHIMVAGRCWWLAMGVCATVRRGSTTGTRLMCRRVRQNATCRAADLGNTGEFMVCTCGARVIANNIETLESAHFCDLLKDEIVYRGISQKKLAADIGVSYVVLNDMMNNCKHPVSTQYVCCSRPHWEYLPISCGNVVGL